MKVYRGKNVCNGIAIGKISFWEKPETDIPHYPIKSPCEEVLRFKSALMIAKSQLETLKTKAISEVGEEGAAIFEVHKMMLEDKEYVDSVEEIIYEQKINAEYSVKLVAEKFASLLSSIDDNYMKSRAIEIGRASCRERV